MRGGPLTYLSVLASEDVGGKVAGAVADHGGEPLEPEGARTSPPSSAPRTRSPRRSS